MYIRTRLRISLIIILLIGLLVLPACGVPAALPKPS